MIHNLDYFYDAQIRRYLEQLVRAFSGFQYQTGMNASGQPQLVMVPCRMANTSRMTAAIMRNNSDNTLLTCPLIALNLVSLAGRREDVQNPNSVESLTVTERQIVDGKYTTNQGNSFTVDRIMPLPFQLMVDLDIWTSNLDQKLQLAEQILTVIYPTFDIQNGVNPIDWTSLTTVFVEDITLTSRSMPLGANEEIDIMTIHLRLPIWLSPPVKVKRQRLIQQIITNISSATEVNGVLEEGALLSTVITTPGNYSINVLKGVITLNPDGPTDVTTWESLLSLYGVLEPTISVLNLYKTDDIHNSAPISGTIQLGSQPNQLLWQINPLTLPPNTLTAISGVIDPLRTSPLTGAAVVDGTRYMILNDIAPSVAWGNVTAYENDIIQYSSDIGSWSVTFSAHETTTTQYVLNLFTGSQMQWNGSEWVMTVDGFYGPGYWTLNLTSF